MSQILSTPLQLGQLLLSARKRKGLTQAQAAGQVGISQSRLSVLESDPRSITLEQLMALTALYDLRLAVEDKAAPTGSPPAPKAEW